MNGNPLGSENAAGANPRNEKSEQNFGREFSWWVRFFLSVLIVTGGLACGLFVGFVINFGGCYEASCSPLEQYAEKYMPFASLLITAPLSIILMKSVRPPAKCRDDDKLLPDAEADIKQPNNYVAVSGFILAVGGIALFLLPIYAFSGELSILPLIQFGISGFVSFTGLLLSIVGLIDANRGAPKKKLAWAGFITAAASCCLYTVIFVAPGVWYG